ncbi:MAG: 3-deoxy-7-phosphoheptulonate synthase [Anaerolineae bacterium]|nr:3-deoxy-7-phosphoheptulonate synthase [Anaerolineae bacterium]MCB0224841.1 3-deoxy-7-phosphoheptulonate synthase [Anaerolineae bacterium]MCB9107183.1 3-deoxy-7-phosphoheptulonate synthase [Anaerolineales bacterium]
MIIIMDSEATPFQIDNVIAEAEGYGWQTHLSQGSGNTVIGLQGNGQPLDLFKVGQMPGVRETMAITQQFKLASRTFSPEDTTFKVRDVTVGNNELVVIAGPCSVESREQLLETAHAVKEAGATMLRGGAYKPRSSPYSFQGLGETGLKLLAEAREATGLPVVTEVMSPTKVALVAVYADVLQIGARNMQNYDLLNAVGQAQKPVLLKRGMSATLEDLLMAAEYILRHGNTQVMLCERGVRTFDTKYTRNTFDVNAIPLLKELSHLPVIADPSHGIGIRRHVLPITLSSVAAGADGLIIETHPDPDKAVSDGPQSLTLPQFADLMNRVRRMASAVGRSC